MANEELNKRVYVKEIKEFFGLKQECGTPASLERWIIAPDVNRPGLELTGHFEATDLKRVVILGNKESRYVEHFSYEEQKRKFDSITDSYTPCIIITDGNKVPKALADLAVAKDFPVFTYPDKTYGLIVDLVSFMSEKLAPSIDVHGVMMNIYGKGVLLTGDSGIGKSELALYLIQRGHIFVADDLVEVSKVANKLYCTAPEILKGFLEIRGLGVVDVEKMFGGNCFLNKCRLDMVIHLTEMTGEVDRLNNEKKTMNLLGINSPLIEVPVSGGRYVSVIVESAVTNFILKQNGIDSTSLFKQRVMEAIIKKGDKN